MKKRKLFDVYWRGHLLSCRLDVLRCRWRRFLFWIRFPNYCRSCDAEGGSGSPGGYMCPPEFDVCEGDARFAGDEDCSRCHRCGDRGLTEDGDGPCSKCGWNYDDAAPSVEGCFGACEWERYQGGGIAGN